ncbi:HD domain-containing protein [Patescibacteria group bacterium]|nr:HD domain-containing protein [Patescibacteria group bacterium]MBU1896061.1 HD domain-containing protein [Patescibacteria group bacterium]
MEKNETQNMENRELENIVSEVEKLEVVQAEKGIWQNKFHEFDVYSHTIFFVNSLKEILGGKIDNDLIVAGLLHDIGKPVVAMPKIKDGVELKTETGEPYHEFDDHEKVGEVLVSEMDGELFDKFGLDKKRIARLVGSHSIPMRGIKEMRKTLDYDSFRESFFRMKGELQNTGLPVEDIMTMFFADKLAQGKHCTDRGELFAVRECILQEDDLDSALRNVYKIQKDAYGKKE